jgi:hypothetical protein
MKISYRTHPILKKLHEHKLGVVGLFVEDEYIKNDFNFIQELRENFKIFAQKFASNVELLSKPFNDTMVLAKDKMIADDLWNSVEYSTGTILNFIGFNLCYYIEPIDKMDESTGLIFYNEMFYMFLGDVLVLYALNWKGTSRAWCSKRLEDVFSRLMPNSTKAEKWHESHLHYKTALIALINFIKYAPIEVKNLPNKSKTKDILCKYVNDTDVKIKVLDSKWFTTLVKSDAFKVRGHFRLQPKKKEGEWTKELIWINEFEKHGYTAPARKLKEHNNAESI